MCGIVGYIGSESAKEIIIAGLEKLEYRGYDSSGIALCENKELKVIKSVGKIANLKEKLSDENHTLGIGHTRWATHGVPNETNAHPHVSQNKLITLVHNGVIENYIELKEEFLSDYIFYSETDTEVLANLLEKFLMDGLTIKEAFIKFIEVVDGSYALAIVYSNEPDYLYVLKNKSPILIGEGSGFNMLGSDALAMYGKTSKVIEINDKEFGIISANKVELFDKLGNSISRDSFTISIDASDAEKGIYPHYMLKEIYDQPTVIRKIVNEYLPNGKINIDENILKLFNEASCINIVAAGTSYYSGFVSKSLLEKNLNKAVNVHIASEFTYDTPFIEPNTLFIFISQSGETADLRSALVKVKEMGYKSFTITNVEGSTLAREVDNYMLLHAGREISVASTKAFVAQLTVLSILGYALSDKSFDLYTELSKVSFAIEDIFEHRNKIEKLSMEYLVGKEHAFYIGRSIDYKLALEGALKIKEISYIHTDGFSAGELKHGTIALIEENTSVVAIITQGNVELNTRSSIMEVEARGANVMTLSMEKYSKPGDKFVISNLADEIAPIAMVVVLQLLAYYTALHMDCEIDMPRNLAKSVTVE